MITGVLILQVVLALGAFVLGVWLSRGQRLGPVAFATASLGALALMLAFPLMRLVPAHAIGLFGPALVAMTEFTGVSIPGAALFGLATPRLARAAERRAVYALLVIAGVYVVKAGWWMVGSGVGELGPTRWAGDVCLQSNDSTCVAASMVTMLASHGVRATETEMASLSFVEPGGGTTDSRAAWALHRALASAGRVDLNVRYRAVTLDELASLPKPTMVVLRWGFFVSHMVCVMDADAESVTLGDPLVGRRVVSVQAFLDEWNGLAMWLE